MIKAIIFDLDDTLVVEKASADAALLETCELVKTRYQVDPEKLCKTVKKTCRTFWHQSPVRQYCLDIGISSWEGLWSKFNGENGDLAILRDWAPSYRRNTWYESLCKHGIDDIGFSLILGETFPQNRRKRHIVYNDVLPVLEDLKKTYFLGLLTNGATDLQNEKIDGAGIRNYFHQIICSGELGYAKPNSLLFKEILIRFNVTAKQAIMIGDSLRKDILGAQSLGMKTVWVNRDGTGRDNSIVPDFEISNLIELKKVLPL
jgi:putative hydrolase of the HAD superfamily